MLLIKVSSKSQLLFKFLIFMKFTCVISWVIISMVCSSCILSSRVGRFKCRSWRVASSFTKKIWEKDEICYHFTTAINIYHIWMVLTYNTESETLSQIIYNDFLSCLVYGCEQKLTFLFDFRHFKLDLLHSIYPATQSEQKIKSITNPIYTPFWLSFVK